MRPQPSRLTTFLAATALTATLSGCDLTEVNKRMNERRLENHTSAYSPEAEEEIGPLRELFADYCTEGRPVTPIKDQREEVAARYGETGRENWYCHPDGSSGLVRFDTPRER